MEGVRGNMEININKLLKCPFCGADAVMFEDYRYRNDPTDMWLVYGVMCQSTDCIMHQSQKFYTTDYDARNAWNRRTIKND